MLTTEGLGNEDSVGQDPGMVTVTVPGTSEDRSGQLVATTSGKLAVTVTVAASAESVMYLGICVRVSVLAGSVTVSAGWVR